MAIIEVKPIEKEKWYKNEKANFIIRPIKLQCAIDPKTRKYAFPATEDEIKDLQERTGFNLDLNFKVGQVHEFFDSEISHVQLQYGSNFFDTDNPLDLIKLYILKGNDLVANSMEEYLKNKYPNAKFVIYSPNEEEEIKASKQSLRRNAIVEMTKLTTDKKLNYALILSGKDYSKQSVDVIDLKLEEIIQEKPEAFLNLLNRKNEDVVVETIILKLIYSRILMREGTIIKYGDLIIGADMPSAIKFLQSPKNQVLRLQLQEKLTE